MGTKNYADNKFIKGLVERYHNDIFTYLFHFNEYEFHIKRPTNNIIPLLYQNVIMNKDFALIKSGTKVDNVEIGINIETEEIIIRFFNNEKIMLRNLHNYGIWSNLINGIILTKKDIEEIINNQYLAVKIGRRLYYYMKLNVLLR